MKITKARLKQIIKEEMGYLAERDDDPDAAVDEEEEAVIDDGDMDPALGDDDELESMLDNLQDSLEDIRAKLGMS